MSPVVVAEVVRSGFVEGRHHGSVVAVDADGRTTYSAGNATDPVLPRSCNKPLQLLGMLRAGLQMEPRLLAIATSSHSAEPFHLEAVREILHAAGLHEGWLQTPPSWPIADEVRDYVVRAGGQPVPLMMDCSGKHAAMLMTCRQNGWPLESYLHPEHPLQQEIVRTFVELTGEPVAHVAVDGCGAPLLATSLTGLARAFSRIARGLDGHGRPDDNARRVADAIRGFPEYVSGTTRDEARLLRALPGSIAKAGAESCYAVALPDGRAFALKIDDGGTRARPVVMAALLSRAGVDTSGIAGDARLPILGGGREVGELRAVLRD